MTSETLHFKHCGTYSSHGYRASAKAIPSSTTISIRLQLQPPSGFTGW